jgi:hypothetical protein
MGSYKFGELVAASVVIVMFVGLGRAALVGPGRR